MLHVAALRMGLLVGASLAPPGSRAVPCLKYEPENVALVGRIQAHRFAGPPNYTSVKQGDKLEVHWLLHLARPVCVASSDPHDRFNRPEASVSALQIVIRDYRKYRRLLGKQVKVTGTLFHAITGHHYTKVLIDASDIEPAD